MRQPRLPKSLHAELQFARHEKLDLPSYRVFEIGWAPSICSSKVPKIVDLIPRFRVYVPLFVDLGTSEVEVTKDLHAAPWLDT